MCLELDVGGEILEKIEREIRNIHKRSCSVKGIEFGCGKRYSCGYGQIRLFFLRFFWY